MRNCYYLIKWRQESRRYEYNEELSKSYAWWKIAQAVPESGEPLKDIKGKIIDPSEKVELFENYVFFKPHLKEANILAKKICATIYACRE